VESAAAISLKRFVVEIYCILEERFTTKKKGRPNSATSKITLYFLVSVAFPLS
jgi:hypothetical protein